MAHYNPENSQQLETLNDIIRRQLQEADGVATQELSIQDQVLPNAESMSVPMFDTNAQGSMSQELIAIADTGKSLFSFVQTSMIDADGANPRTRIALTEMPRYSGQGSRLVHVFEPGSEANAGIQPLDQGTRSRMQALVDHEGDLHLRLDPGMPVGSTAIDGNPISFSYAWGRVIDTPPQDWAVGISEMQAVARQETQAYQYQ